jgi:hypothetical protein
LLSSVKDLLGTLEQQRYYLCSLHRCHCWELCILKVQS